ncbi:MAG TPA: carboxypeptidase-like regulatory domain-containing protein [Terracidiphilus sp.]|nr:carboxypeptidase-like regulatory domain-containing protein [Terracidiphilus sp.]
MRHLASHWIRKYFTAVVTFMALLCCSAIYAQSGAGSIQGTVTDPTGAVIQAASIHVVNQATGVAQDTKSNGVGFYQVPGLFTGTYTVTVTASGMKTYKRTIELLVGQSAVIDTTLTAGEVTQQVEVTANAVQLTTTDNGSISSTLENSRIEQLPMNGRNLITLTSQTTPGLESCSQSSSCPNGLMGQAMEYVADGASLSNREFGGTHTGASEMPDPDSVQEVRVESTGAGAQFATPATAILTTKSGTNRLHGSAFETARNNYFGIARNRSNPSNFVAPPYIRNEFGASAGGPIILPHVYHGKDRSFWFFAYERYSLRSYGYQNMKVPTAAMKQGDFSGLVNSSNVLQELYDPNTTTVSANCTLRDGTIAKDSFCRTPFANNQIPFGRLSPTGKIINDITVLPSNSNNPLVANNLAGQNPNNTTIPTITFRLDHSFSENNKAYLRYTNTNTKTLFLRNDPSSAAATLAADGMPAAASNVSINSDILFAVALGYTHIFSPTFYSEMVASQSWFSEQNGAGGTPSANFEQKLGLPNNFGEVGFPYFSGILSPLDGTQFQYGVTSIVTTLDENLTKTVGKHQMMFGGRFRHERFGSRPDQIKDTISFGGNGTGLEDPTTDKTLAFSKLANTGYADADLFLGSAASYSVNIEPPYQHLHDMEFDAYFQDNYRLRRNLTLNIGLRYEAHPAIWSKFGMMEGFDLKNHAIVTAATPAELIANGLTTQAIINNDILDGAVFETPAQAGMPANTLTNNDDFTFGPRVGIAYLPFGGRHGTVLRGAYGRYIYPEPIRNFMVSVNRSNPFTAGYSMNYNASNQAPDNKSNWQLRTPQTVVTGVNSANVVNSTTTNAILPGFGVTNLNPDFPSTYVTQTNFTLEQPLKGNSALRLSYLYTHGQNLAENYNFNAHPSTYVWELMTGTIPPKGNVVGSNQYSSTATGPYDQITYGGGLSRIQKSGWSNDHIFQANYQRLFHHGVAYQIAYSWSKPFRIGSNSSRDSTIAPYLNYTNSGLGLVTPYTSATGFGTFNVIAPALPLPPPAGTASYGYYRALNRFQNYQVDTAVPKQHIQFNGIVDLPVGRHKRFMGNVNRFVDELVGGYQIAGSGSVASQDFGVTSSHWGATNPLKIYKKNAPITDCRSGLCYKSYEWFNGYIAPTALSGNSCSAGLSTVVSGLPSNWTPYSAPSDQGCGAPTTVKGVLTANVDKYYGSDYINMTTTDGKTAPLAYSPGSSGSNPYDKTVLNGPFNWSADASIFKVFPITERWNLRFNMDAFNVFNVQGMNNPSGSDGTVGTTPGGVGYSSHNTPRQIQFTLRLTF